MSEKLQCNPENAIRFSSWIRLRGGIAVWESANLGNPCASWSTPALGLHGEAMGRPTWEACDKPARIVTSADDVEVTTGRGVKRLRIAIKRGDGLSLVLTDASSRKLRAACDAAGDSSWYEFDGDGGAVVFVPGDVVTLSEWLAR